MKHQKCLLKVDRFEWTRSESFFEFCFDNVKWTLSWTFRFSVHYIFIFYWIRVQIFFFPFTLCLSVSRLFFWIVRILSFSHRCFFFLKIEFDARFRGEDQNRKMAWQEKQRETLSCLKNECDDGVRGSGFRNGNCPPESPTHASIHWKWFWYKCYKHWDKKVKKPSWIRVWYGVVKPRKTFFLFNFHPNSHIHTIVSRFRTCNLDACHSDMYAKMKCIKGLKY